MKKLIEFLKELKKKPYGKGVFFFGFYLVFFIIVFFIINIGGVNDKIKEQNNNNSNTSNGINIVELNKNNYEFEYKVILDNTTYLYVGSKNNHTFNYVYNNKNYYNIGDKSYASEDKKEIDNQIKFYKLFNEDIIHEIIVTSYIESKTIYDSGDIEYNLLLDSNKLEKILNNKDTDVDELANRVKATISEDNLIKEVNYNLDNYCKIDDSCNSLNITIVYKNFSDKS